MTDTGMVEDLRVNWGWLSLRGLLSIAFGCLALLWPGITLAALVILWGAYALADGVLALIAAVRIRDQGGPFWALILVGLAGIAAGIATFAMPQITALVLIVFIASWALISGFFQIVAAIRLRREIDREWLLAFCGALTIAMGVLLLLRPGIGAVAIVWTLGFYAIIAGVSLMLLGLRIRGHAHPRPLGV